MTVGITRSVESIQWLPAERLGQLTVDAHVRPWLIGKGLLTLRMKLCAHPWLAELGDSALGETLSDLSGVERSSYEYAWLPVEEPVTARALRDAEVRPAGLWARRSRVSVRSAPMLMQELFLPAIGRV